MTDLADLDRRAALTMGLKIATWPTIQGDWYKASHGFDGVDARRFRPTLDANDCREFKQYGITRGLFYLTSEREHSFVVDILRAGDVVKWVAKCETTKEEHGPTYDLVACVIAILAALEAQND